VRGIDDVSFSDFDRKRPIVIQATLDELSQDELAKLRPWTDRGVLTVRKEYTSDESGKIAAEYCATMPLPKEPWLRDDFEDYKNSDIVRNLPIGEFIPGSGRITKEIYAKAIEDFKARYPERITYQVEMRRNPAGFKQVLDGYMPEFHFMPAVRDVTEETKTQASALLGKLMNLVIARVATQNPSFQQLQKALREVERIIEGNGGVSKLAEVAELERSLEQALAIWDVKVDINVKAPDVQRVFELGTKVNVFDGLATDISDKGHGLQRSLIFALLRVWAGQSRQVGETTAPVRQRSNIFAFEEPELFLHPQVARATYEALRELGRTDQVMIATHSPHFVNMEDYLNVAMIRKTSQERGSEAVRTPTDLFGADSDSRKHFNLIKFCNPDRNEMFFARKVVLVEGQTEKSVLPLLARRLELFDHAVTIVNCEGKTSIILCMRVLNAFKIPYLAAYDKDDQPSLNEAIERAVEKDIGESFCVDPCFEVVAGVPQPAASKRSKPFAAVEYFNNPEVALSPALEELVRRAYR
jgi:CRISPR-associated exonuclease Cas4